ncbi:hypothetical protein ABPG74_016623 [Tetrahymena malaccensis]
MDQPFFDIQQEVLSLNDEIELLLHYQNYLKQQKLCQQKEPQIEESDQQVQDEIFNKVDIDQIANINEIGDFLQDLQCPICLNIIEDPMSCIRCELNYCNSCINEWSTKKSQNVCPTCRNNQQVLLLNGKQHLYKKSSIIFKKILEKVKVKCYKTGCQDVVKYDERQNHISKCQYQQVKCLNQGCKEPILRKDLQDHLKNCQYRMVLCIHCQENHPFCKLEAHIEKCKYNQRICINCNKKFQAHYFQLHQKICKKFNPLRRKNSNFDIRLKSQLMYKTILHYDQYRSKLPLNINLLDTEKVKGILQQK